MTDLNLEEEFENVKFDSIIISPTKKNILNFLTDELDTNDKKSDIFWIQNYLFLTITRIISYLNKNGYLIILVENKIKNYKTIVNFINSLDSLIFEGTIFTMFNSNNNTSQPIFIWKKI